MKQVFWVWFTRTTSSVSKKICLLLSSLGFQLCMIIFSNWLSKLYPVENNSQSLEFTSLNCFRCRLTYFSLNIQAAGVLAQIEKSNKKKQGIQVESFFLSLRKLGLSYFSIISGSSYLSLCGICMIWCSGTRKKRKDSRQRSWRLMREKETLITPQQGSGMME